MKTALKNPLLRASVAVTTFLLSTSAHADLAPTTGGGGADLLSVTDAASSSIYSLTILISTASYVGGTCFAVAGLSALKKHTEEPGREPIGKGVGRLVAGAAMVAAPAAINIVINSMGLDPNQAVGVTNASGSRGFNG